MRDWIPQIFSERNDDPDPRSNTKLKENTRKKIAYITSDYVTRADIADAYSEYLQRKGEETNYFATHNRDPAFESNHRFIVKEEHIDVIEYLELLINVTWSNSSNDQEELFIMNKKSTKR